MKYAKIIVKSNYEKRGDLVLRSYVRALKEIHEEKLLDGEDAFIYGVIDDNEEFHELFTNEVINYNDCVLIDLGELFDAATVSKERRILLEKIMKKVLFGEDINLDFEISSKEDLARDRRIEFEAYDKFLSRINPYMRLSERDNEIDHNGYNNFLYKIEQLKIMRKLDNQEKNYDLYDIYNYEERPSNETDEKEYLVFEVPKKLIRK